MNKDIKYDFIIKIIENDDGQWYNLDTKRIVKTIEDKHNIYYDDKEKIYSTNQELLQKYVRIIFNIKNIHKFINNTENKYYNLETGKFILKKHTYFNDEYKITCNDKNIYDIIYKYLTSKDNNINNKNNNDNSKNNNDKNINNDNAYGTNEKRLRPKIPKNIREEVWKKSFGKMSSGECFCCLEEINTEQWEAGHILPYHYGGCDEVYNLKPICRSCNRSMSSLHMYEYMLRYNKDGCKNLEINKDYIFYSGLVNLINKCITKLDIDLKNNSVSLKDAENLKNKLLSSAQQLDIRLNIIDIILKNKYNLI